MDLIRICLSHGQHLHWCPLALDWTCIECSHDAAERGLMQATDEALRLLDDGPERYTQPSQFETEILY